MDKEVIRKLNKGIFEVVVSKIEDTGITYEHPLPFEKLPFQIRNDKFHSIGTAFAISPTQFVSAAHVFGPEAFGYLRDFQLRDNLGTTYKVKTIQRYSNYRDLIQFDLETYPTEVIPVQQAARIEAGDAVFAVGNAHGEGISFRGGQVASFTPEESNGAWKFIRFSAPASPGNSGGPLLTPQGEVVGVVTRKSESENYNYAVPIQEVAGLSISQAEFFSKGLSLKDGMAVVSEDWKDSAPLPCSYAALSQKAQASLNGTLERLQGRLATESRQEIFPDSDKFRDYLRNQDRGILWGVVEKDNAAKNWKVTYPKTREIKIGADQNLYIQEGHSSEILAVIEKPPTTALKDFVGNPKLVLESMSRAIGMYREFAGEKIRFTSFGQPAESELWTDELGRTWTTSVWPMKYGDSVATTDCMPVPKGAACVLRLGSSSLLGQFNRHSHRLNVREYLFSYWGPVKAWREFLALDQKLLPSLLRGAQVEMLAGGKLSIRMDGMVAEHTVPHLDGDSTFSTILGYSTRQRLGLEVIRYNVRPRENREDMFSVTTAYSPLASDEPARKKTWEDINRRAAPYNGKAFVSGQTQMEYSVMKQFNLKLLSSTGGPPGTGGVRVASAGATRAPASAPATTAPTYEGAQKFHIAICVVDNAHADYKIDEACRKFNAGIR